MNYLSIRRADSADLLPVHSLHTRGTLEWGMESDLTLPGEWRGCEGLIPLPSRRSLANLRLPLTQFPDPLIGESNPVCLGPGDDFHPGRRAFSSNWDGSGALPEILVAHDVVSGESPLTGCL